MDLLAESLKFERNSLLKRGLNRLIVNPLANYLPSGLLRGLLRFGKSELAAANWGDPGGWRSMVISYDGNPRQVADKILVSAGTMSKALRNRRHLAAAIIADLIDKAQRQPAHVLCLGAGPGCIISDALGKATASATATLIDLSSDAFVYGQELAQKLGIGARMRFIVGDARDIDKLLDRPVDVVKLLGICEYLTDEQISNIIGAVAKVMPQGSAIVTNSLSRAHGTDRFFRRVFGLHMEHRDVRHLQKLMAPAGFGNFSVVGEPLGVYDVMVGWKT